jgi:hypothetical protein
LQTLKLSDELPALASQQKGIAANGDPHNTVETANRLSRSPVVSATLIGGLAIIASIAAVALAPCIR